MSENTNGSSNGHVLGVHAKSKVGSFRKLIFKSKKYFTLQNLKLFVGYSIAVSVLLLTLLISSTFIYANIYRLYVPKMQHQFPLYFQFITTEDPVATLNFNVPFMRKGVAYDMVLDLQIPDIPGLPEKVGNFMIKLEMGAMKGNDKIVKLMSSRPSHLKFRSKFIKFMLTILKCIPIMIGWIEETVHQKVFLVESVIDPIRDGSRFISLTLASEIDVPVYEANLLVVAHLEGLRYYMYFWFFTVAIIAILILTFIQLLACTFNFFVFRKVFIGRKQKVTMTLSSESLSDQLVNDHYDNDLVVPSMSCKTTLLKKRFSATGPFCENLGSSDEADFIDHEKRE